MIQLMNIPYKRIGVAGALIGLLAGCQQPLESILECKLEGIQTDSVYLYRVLNERYGQMDPVLSIPVKEDAFSCPLDTLPTGLYCLSLQNIQRGELLEQYANLFLEPERIRVTLKTDEGKQLVLHSQGSPLQLQYEQFLQKKNEAEYRQMLDSLDGLFYAARDRDDREEMERIRELSMPYYTEGRNRADQLVSQQLDSCHGTRFGLYLYYTYRFRNRGFNTLEEIAEVRRYLAELSPEVQKSFYFTKMTESLNRFAACATGSQAPEIVGKGLDGKTVRLSDFKGRYVLVDFWFAGCFWCRKEGPYLKKAYHSYREKGFTILGVSTDRDEVEWRQAIRDEQSDWNHLLLEREDVRSVLETYCIVGFPHIILIDPEGRIIAKELRGDDLVKTVEFHLSKP